MTILEEVPVVVTEPRPKPPPMIHRLCCLDHSKTVCGIKRERTEKTESDYVPHVDCIVCDDIWYSSTYCPREGETCPNENRMNNHDH